MPGIEMVVEEEEGEQGGHVETVNARRLAAPCCIITIARTLYYIDLSQWNKNEEVNMYSPSIWINFSCLTETDDTGGGGVVTRAS